MAYHLDTKRVLDITGSTSGLSVSKIRKAFKGYKVNHIYHWTAGSGKQHAFVDFDSAEVAKGAFKFIGKSKGYPAQPLHQSIVPRFLQVLLTSERYGRLCGSKGSILPPPEYDDAVSSIADEEPITSYPLQVEHRSQANLYTTADYLSMGWSSKKRGLDSSSPEDYGRSAKLPRLDEQYTVESPSLCTRYLTPDFDTMPHDGVTVQSTELSGAFGTLTEELQKERKRSNDLAQERDRLSEQLERSNATTDHLSVTLKNLRSILKLEQSGRISQNAESIRHEREEGEISPWPPGHERSPALFNAFVQLEHIVLNALRRAKESS